MAQFKRTEAALLRIRGRQWKQRWGAEYVAAIFADAKEAPGISTGTVLRPSKLGGRELHVLSESEEGCAIFGLYNPDCFEIHEQFVLFPTARPHPLAGHPRARGAAFKPILGTLDVAERLGVLSKHPRIRMFSASQDRRLIVPFPLLGDLRLFMDSPGGPYCIDWPVKGKYEDFRRKGPRAKPRPLDDLEDSTTVARLELQKTYHSDADIRTHQASKDKIDLQLRLNLAALFLEESHPVPLASEHRDAAMAMARSFIGVDSPMYLVARRLAREFRIDDREAKAFICQGIWRRQLRVDLFRPVLMNKPLRPEVTDALVKYSDWFARKA